MKILNRESARCISRSALCLVAAMAAVLGSRLAWAQDMSTRAMSTRSTAASEGAKTRAEEYRPLGVRVGRFFLNPVLEGGLAWDSNVFAFPDEVEVTNDADPEDAFRVKFDGLKRSDVLAFGTAATKIRSDWNRHEFNALVWVKGGAYREYTSEDFLDYKLTGNGRIDVSHSSFFKLRAGYMHLHQNRSSLNNRLSAELTEFDLAYLGAGYDHQFNRLGVRFDLDYVALDFDNARRVDGALIDNDQRDRGRTEAKTRLTYELVAARNVFIEGAVNRVDYDQKVDNAGREKSSNGYKITAGMNFNLTSLIVGDVFIGYVEQIYDDPIFVNLSDPLVGFGLLWYATGLTTVAFELDRNPQESASPRQSGYISTNFRAEVNHELLRNLILVGGLTYVHNRYEQLSPQDKEKDVTYGADFGVKYLFSRTLYARGDYYYRTRNSDFASQDYDKSRIEFAIGANW